MTRVRSIGSIKAELVTKAKESALCAIKVFNDPLIKFKSGAFVVLMVIAWTYLIHAYYRSKGVDYRYFRQTHKRKRYDKTRHESTFDDVPREIARLVHESSGSPISWNKLTEDKKEEKELKAKRMLCTRAPRYMTKALLDQIDPSGDLLGWFREMAALLAN